MEISLFFDNESSKTKRIRESPPAWTQEAYHPLCSEYSFWCPNWVPPIWTWLGGTLLGVPCQGAYPGHGIPPVRTWPGIPHQNLAGGTLVRLPPSSHDLARYPPSWPGRVPPLAGPGRVPLCLSHGILGNVAKHHGSFKKNYGMGTPVPQLDLAGYPPPRCLPHGILRNVAKHYGMGTPPCNGGQTENITYRRTTYAGGNKV